MEKELDEISRDNNLMNKTMTMIQKVGGGGGGVAGNQSMALSKQVDIYVNDSINAGNRINLERPRHSSAFSTPRNDQEE